MIKKSAELAEIVERAKKAGRAAIDTEFVWERTYFPQLGLIQIGLSEEENFLIDAPAIDDLSPIGQLLEDESVVKILHDAQQDLYILRRATGAYPKNIFDTRLAGGFARLSSTISLMDLLKEVVGVSLPKTESRTDWLRRPLSDRQVAYAIDDVRYMPRVMDELIKRVDDAGRSEWLAEELSVYDDPALYEEKDPRTQYGRLKGVSRMGGDELSVLRELAAWREEEARRHDRPRGHILKDDIVVTLAKRRPGSKEEMQYIKAISDRDVRCYGRAVVQAIKKGLETGGEDISLPPSRNGVDEILSTRIDLALAYLKGKCLSSGLDMGLLTTRAEVTALLAEGPQSDAKSHRLLRGWRRIFAGDELLQVMAGEYAIRLDRNTGLPQLVSD
ncbi:MAG: HRDC domain-containing protein [Proteobacteria bacterium]|nr:HRDC domain-containing protein [Pseudomonadota bacterium]